MTAARLPRTACVLLLMGVMLLGVGSSAMNLGIKAVRNPPASVARGAAGSAVAVTRGRFLDFLAGSAAVVVGSSPSQAAAPKASTLQESKDALNDIQAVADEVSKFSALAAKKDAESIARSLQSPLFARFESACTTLVRSEALSAEDKEALGTIRRYGVVADAIIMIGGIGAELKAGGFEIGDGSAPDIWDEEDNAEMEVNFAEVARYTKLAQGSLGDVLRIAAPLAKK